MGPQNPLTIAARILNLSPTTGSLCPYNRDFYGSVLERMLFPVLSLVQLLVSYAVLQIVALVRSRWTGGPIELFDRSRWLVRPLQALALSAYTPLAFVVASVLTCRSVASGAYSVVSAAPGYSCTSTVYHSYFAAAVVIAVVYLAGLPSALAAVLFAYRKRLTDSRYQDTFGYTFQCYRPQLFFWEVVVLARRAVMIVLGIVLDPNTKQLLLAFASLAFLVLHYAAWPHNTLLENGVEAVSLALLTLIAVVEASSFAQQPSEQNATAGVVSAAFVAAIVVMALALLYSYKPRITAVLQSVLQRLGLRTNASSLGNEKSESLQESLLSVESSVYEEDKAL